MVAERHKLTMIGDADTGLSLRWHIKHDGQTHLIIIDHGRW